MKKIVYSILLTSILIADVPVAGRPNPGAFEDESVPLLDHISTNLEDMKNGISNLYGIREDIDKINRTLERLMWYLDHNTYKEDYQIKESDR